MKIAEFIKTADKKKVNYFFAGMDKIATDKKPFFKKVLSEKPVGKLRVVITNQMYTFKVTGTFYFEGEPFYCDACKEMHRQIVLKVDEVMDMTGSIIGNMN